MTESVSEHPGGSLARALRGAAGLVLTSATAGLLAMTALVGGAWWWVPSTLAGPVAEGGWTSRSRACVLPGGFYSPEIDADTGRSFSWTGPTARLVFPHLARTQVHQLSLRVRAVRSPDVRPPAALRVTVDGVIGAVVERPPSEPLEVTVDVPPRARDGALVTLDVSDTFVPGPHDTRRLGVIVDAVNLTASSGRFLPVPFVVGQTGLAVALCVSGVLLCGLRKRLALAVAGGLAFGLAWLLLADGAFIGPYAARLLRLGAGVALCGALIAVVGFLRPRTAAGSEWPIAAGVVLGAATWTLAVFAHPLVTVGDAIFQVHRAQLVQAGQYFFTSVTPRPFFEFPYPVALYVAAKPFWKYFSSTSLELALLLRGVALVANVLVGIALFAAARRQWNDRRAALLCAALWPFAAAPLQALSNANLTNVFGQGMFGVAMGGLAWLSAGPASLPAVAVTAAFLTGAFLSHFSTVAIGLSILGVVAVALLALGRGHARRAGAWAVALTIAASALSYAVYYSHFTPVFRETLQRVVSSREEAAPSKLVAPPSVKLKRWFDGTGDDYGRPSLVLLVTAACGAVLLVRRRRREGVTLAFVPWALVWVGFTLLGILSPLSMRANLATAPVFVVLAAYALGALSRRSRRGATAAAAVALVIAWDGVRVCLAALGITCLGCSALLGFLQN